MADAPVSIVRAVSVLFVLAVTRASFAQPTDMTQPLASIDFATGSSELDSQSREQLRGVVSWAQDHPWRLVVVQAYADRTGTRSGNLVLSQDRADAVRAGLVALGLPPQRLVSAAYGEDDPAAARRVVVRGTTDDFRDLVEPTPPAPPASRTGAH